MSRARRSMYDDGSGDGDGDGWLCITRTTFLFHISWGCVSRVPGARARIFLSEFPIRREPKRIYSHLITFYTFSFHFSRFARITVFLLCLFPGGSFHCGKYFVRFALLVMRRRRQRAVSVCVLHPYFDLFDFPFGYSPDGIEFPSSDAPLDSASPFFSSIRRSCSLVQFSFCFLLILFCRNRFSCFIASRIDRPSLVRYAV